MIRSAERVIALVIGAIVAVSMIHGKSNNIQLSSDFPIYSSSNSQSEKRSTLFTILSASLFAISEITNRPLTMWGSSQQVLGIPGPQKLLKTLGSLWLSQTTADKASLGASSTCSLSEVSCQSKYHGQDTCCYNYPGGHILQTQFWDVDPSVGPNDSWTIHGLWYAP